MKLNPATRPKESRKLLRILGVGFGIAVTIGSTVGLGILRAPGTVAGQIGIPWLILAVWLLGGMYALLGTLAVAELGTSITKAGGWYVYAQRAFGDYAGFTVGWINWIAFCGALASLAITFGEYTGALWPALAGQARPVAIAAVLLFSLMQWRGVRFGSRAQELMCVVTALGFLALVASCFIFGGRQVSSEAPRTAMNIPGTLPAFFAAVVLSLQFVIFTYDGWYGAIYFTEEDCNPARNLPRAMLGGVSLIIVIYLLVNLALLYVVQLPQLAASQLAAADAAQLIFGALGNRFITVLALLTLLAVINATLLQNTRILFGLSRDGLFFARAATVNRGGTPGFALALTALTGIVLLLSGTFEKLIAITAFFYVVMYASGFLSLLWLRRREPDLLRPFRAWGHPWTTGVVIFISVVFLIGVIVSDTANSLYALALLLVSYPIYRLITRTGKKRGKIIT